jgi:hypothetical protein
MSNNPSEAWRTRGNLSALRYDTRPQAWGWLWLREKPLFDASSPWTHCETTEMV